MEMAVSASVQPWSARRVTVTEAGTLPVSRFRTTPQALMVSVERNRDRSLANSCHHSSSAAESAQPAQYRPAESGWNADRDP